MKTFFLLSLLALVLPLAAQDEETPVVKKHEEVKNGLMPNQQAFLNLPEESRKDFIKHIGEASRLFEQKRIFESLDELDKTAKIFVDSPELYNLRGSCFVEMRAFDKAMEQFDKASALAKDNPSIQFNIAEVFFVTKKWQQSADLFEKVLKILPANSTALSRLVEFKILLSKRKLGLKDEVTILAGKYDFLDDSPYYYYAQAALAYEDNNLVKAEEWLAIASRVFQDPNVLAPWQDTLVEYGYIKSFYGNDAAPDK